jgi:hypothetical protein
MRALGEGGAWRRKRHGAPNREPPEIRSAQIAEPLCPVRGDDLPAGVVRISGPAPRPASPGNAKRAVTSSRRWSRFPTDSRHLPRACDTTQRATGCVRWLCFWELGFGSYEATPINRAEIAPPYRCRRRRQRSPVSLALAGGQSDGESARACGSAFSAVAGCAPAGNCNTVARWPSHRRVTSTTCPSGNSNAS